MVDTGHMTLALTGVTRDLVTVNNSIILQTHMSHHTSQNTVSLHPVRTSNFEKIGLDTNRRKLGISRIQKILTVFKYCVYL